MKVCGSGKILNPKTNRCVSLDGQLGKKLAKQMNITPMGNKKPSIIDNVQNNKPSIIDNVQNNKPMVKRCIKGTRKDKKTGECVPTNGVKSKVIKPKVNLLNKPKTRSAKLYDISDKIYTPKSRLSPNRLNNTELLSKMKAKADAKLTKLLLNSKKYKAGDLLYIGTPYKNDSDAEGFVMVSGGMTGSLLWFDNDSPLDLPLYNKRVLTGVRYKDLITKSMKAVQSGNDLKHINTMLLFSELIMNSNMKRNNLNMMLSDWKSEYEKVGLWD